MKRILILIKGLGRGGAEQLLASAAPYRDSSRFHYEVAYLLPWKDALAGELERAGVPVQCLEGSRGIGWVARLRALVRQGEFDLVHAHSPVAAAAARAALGRRPRIVYTEHNEWHRYRAATRWANLLTYSRNDHVFCVSRGVLGSVRYPAALRWMGMPPIEALHHGLDPAAVEGWQANGVRGDLGIPDGAPVVGTIANFKAHKGYHLLMEAAAAVRRDVPDARFVLVGQGPLLEDTRRRAAELGIGDAVVFAGYREDAPRVCAAFDVFAIASLNEGLSIALLEAMALGKPPVVTSVGGIPEVVRDQENGILVPPGDPAALAGGIVRLLSDPVLRSEMGEAARLRAADFDIRLAVRRMEAVYAELLS